MSEELSTTSAETAIEGASASSTPNWGMLVASLLLDAIGMATYAIPLLGEAGDVVWAPISAFIFAMMYRSAPGTIINFVEELAPGLDITPTFTLMWIYRTYGQKKADV